MEQRADLEGGDSSTPGQLTGNQTSVDKLKLFRDLVGINPLPIPGRTDPKRPAQNLGTYKRLCDAEIKARLEYYATASAINFCLLAQIVVAAALTALGASNSSHVAITVLGSINTVIAGIMTYLKGQGLPTRLLEYANGLRKVREYIEEDERQFARPDCQLDIDKEIKKCLDMYESVRQNAEDNYPSSWKSLGSSSPKDALITGTGAVPNYQTISAAADGTAAAEGDQAAPSAEAPSAEAAPAPAAPANSNPNSN